jgi:hypothetical protein
MSEQLPPQRYPFAKIVPNILTKKQCLLRFLLAIWDCNSFVQYYLIHTEILSEINSRESGFARILQSDAVISEERWIDIAGPSDWYKHSRYAHVIERH